MQTVSEIDRSEHVKVMTLSIAAPRYSGAGYSLFPFYYITLAQIIICF